MKTNHVKANQGTLKDTRVKGLATKDNLIPLPPECLTKFEATVWVYTWTYLYNNGVSQSVDIYLIERYCINISLEQELKKLITKGGHKHTITNKAGHSYEKISPDFVAYNIVLARIERIEKVIGIGPLWRDGINMKPNKVKSKFDEI